MITEHTDGAFAEYVVARAGGVLRLPEGWRRGTRAGRAHGGGAARHHRSNVAPVTR